MSGSIFGNVTPLQVPDFQRTQANALALMAQRRQMQQQDALQNFFANNAQGLSASDPAKRMNVLAMLAQQGGQGAAMALPMLNQERQRMEFQDIMRGAMGGEGGAPAAAPMPALPTAGGADGFSANGLAINTRSESGGDPNARNSRSTATGANQFIDGTWLAFAQANPQLFQGMSREQILAARSNPELSAQATQWYARQNARALQAANVPVNDATLGLSHQFDGPVAARIYTAPPNTPIEQIVGPAAMRANPDLVGKTTGQVVQQFAQRYGGGAGGGGRAPAPNSNAETVARMDRAIAALTRAGRLDEAARLSQIASGLRRGEAEPLERIRQADGTEILVPRSQAAGMSSAPAPRETPNPLGSNAPGAASQTMRSLNAKVENGTATADEVALWRDAVEIWTSETRNPDGSIIPGRALSPEAQRARDALAQREGRTQDATAAPRPGDPPGPRVETTQTGGQRLIRPPQVSPQDRERWAKIESDSGRVVDAIRGFREALDASGGTGISAYLNNPQDPAAVRLNTAFSNLMTALRGEAFLNTGVLQPGEIALIDRLLLNPQSLRGLLASRESYSALLDQLSSFIDAGLARQRRVVLGQGYAAPDAPQTEGPGGRGTAEPPPATAPSTSPRVLRFNPRTNRIE